ncbi:hypothetical protein ACSBR1_012720 [Camellia fascicularis]
MSSPHNISALPLPPNKKNKQNKHDEILEKIRRGVEKSNFMSGASIYRVPKRLYNLNEKAYTPCLVSIGPLHCKDQHLKTPMQDIKMNYVNSFLARRAKDSDEQKLELLNRLINEMKIINETKGSSSLTDAKKCYAEEVDDELDEEMLVIDGCFILELLYRPHEKRDPHDPIFGSPLTSITVQHDLLLLENQLPFSALDKLFLLTKNSMPTSSSSSSSSSTKPPDSLSDYVRSFFSNITGMGPRFDCPKKSCWKGETESVIIQIEKKETESVIMQVEKKERDYFHILHILVDGFHSFKDGNQPVNNENPVRESPTSSNVECPCNMNQLPFRALDKLFLLTKKLMPTSSSMSSVDSLTLCLVERFGERFEKEKGNGKNLGPGFDTTKSGPKMSCWKGETESVIVQAERKEENYFHILHILFDGFHSFVDGYKPVKKNLVLEALVNILRPLEKFFSW